MGFSPHQGQSSLSATTSRLPVGPAQASVEYYVIRGSFTKANVADNSALPNAKVRHVWGYLHFLPSWQCFVTETTLNAEKFSGVQ